jgi:hypothetical protein
MTDEEAWDDWSDEDEATTSVIASPPNDRQPQPQILVKIKQRLRDYTIQLADPSLKHSLNLYLSKHCSSSSSSTNRSKGSSLYDYYNSNDQLEAYTLEKELHRMEYTLTTLDGVVLDDRTQIAHYFEGRKKRSYLTSLCLRCANQSLLGDLILLLTIPPAAADILDGDGGDLELIEGRLLPPLLGPPCELNTSPCPLRLCAAL